MKQRLIAFLVLVGAWSSQCAGQTRVLGVTLGGCSPVLGEVKAELTIVCVSDKTTEAALLALLRGRPKIEDYNRLAATSDKMRDEIRELSKQLRAVEQRPREGGWQSERDQLERKLINLVNRQEEVRQDLLKQVNAVSEAVLAVMAERFNVSEQTRRAEYEKMTKEFSRGLEDIEKKFSAEIRALDIRIAALEATNATLMEAFVHGKLRDYAGFFAIAVGGAFWGDDKVQRLGAEFEWVAPKLPWFPGRGSAFVEAGVLDWDEKRQFATLPGAPTQEITEEHRFQMVGIGVRLYVPVGDSAAIPLGLSGGTSFGGSDKTPYIAASLGFEYFRQALRIGLDVRYHWFSSVSRRELQFNPFGPSTVSEKESSDGVLTVGARVSWR